MQNFEILFDDAESSALADPVYDPYGNLGFPVPPPDRPWIFSNFVQSLDGIASFKGRHPLGSDISQSEEDRWLMDLLRAHADAVILSMTTTALSSAREAHKCISLEMHPNAPPIPHPSLPFIGRFCF